MAPHIKLLGILLILYWSCWFPIRKSYHFHQKIICPYNWYIPIKTKIYDKRTYSIHFFPCQIKTRCMNTCTQRLTEVYRYPSLFIAKYSLVWTPWIATTRRPTGMRLNRAEISKNVKMLQFQFDSSPMYSTGTPGFLKSVETQWVQKYANVALFFFLCIWLLIIFAYLGL